MTAIQRPTWQQVNLQNMQKNKAYTYLEDTRTGDLYWSEDRATLFTKCFLVFIGTVPATGFRCCYYLLKPIWKVPKTVVKAFAELARTFQKDVCQAFTDFALRITLKLPLSFVKNIAAIARSIICGALIQLAALTAIINPYNARKYVAHIEKALNLGKTYEVSVHNQFANCDSNTSITEIYKMFRRTKAFYLAWCFQSRGNINDVLPGGKRKFVPVTIQS